MSTEQCGSVVRRVSAAVVLALAIIASPAVAQKADRPTVKVGDEWQFMLYNVVPVQKPNVAWVITSVSPSGIAGTWNGKPLTLTPDLNIVESPTRKFSDRRVLNFPLEIGKSWTYANQVETKTDQGDWRMDANVTVAAYEKVTVPAGRFDAYRIEAKGKWGQQGAAGAGAMEFTETSWYAPSARAVVKEVYRDASAGEMVRELTSYKLQP